MITSSFLATLLTVLDTGCVVSNLGMIMGVSRLGGAIVLAGVVSPFLAFLEFLVFAGVADSAKKILD